MFEFESGQRESAFERTSSGYSRYVRGQEPPVHCATSGAGCLLGEAERPSLDRLHQAGPAGGVTTLMKIYFFPAGRLCKLIFIHLAKPFA
ncbi:hypothetical protein [Burkholderia sp. RF2-non_BP3]|uniref:hypothetical protein n=1 Tax=Burkholderia sp. RF2-non_BP3 TaxID=1637844 RepID=UPI0012E34B89|nr:hypothetical protein [Burkholderia sp. RF2-non_BP3]